MDAHAYNEMVGAVEYPDSPRPADKEACEARRRAIHEGRLRSYTREELSDLNAEDYPTEKAWDGTEPPGRGIPESEPQESESQESESQESENPLA